jgi:hypothetical protein
MNVKRSEEHTSAFHYSTYLSSIFSKSFHYSTAFSSIFSISFHYSTYFSSILSKSYHYLTDFSSIFSISFHYSTYFSSVFFISFHYFLPYFQYHFTIFFCIFNIFSLFTKRTRNMCIRSAETHFSFEKFTHDEQTVSNVTALRWLIKIRKKPQLNSEKILKMRKKIVKWYWKYGRK